MFFVCVCVTQPTKHCAHPKTRVSTADQQVQDIKNERHGKVKDTKIIDGLNDESAPAEFWDFFGGKPQTIADHTQRSDDDQKIAQIEPSMWRSHTHKAQNTKHTHLYTHIHTHKTHIFTHIHTYTHTQSTQHTFIHTQSTHTAHIYTHIHTYTKKTHIHKHTYVHTQHTQNTHLYTHKAHTKDTYTMQLIDLIASDHLCVCVCVCVCLSECQMKVET